MLCRNAYIIPGYFCLVFRGLARLHAVYIGSNEEGLYAITSGPLLTSMLRAPFLTLSPNCTQDLPPLLMIKRRSENSTEERKSTQRPRGREKYTLTRLREREKLVKTTRDSPQSRFGLSSASDSEWVSVMCSRGHFLPIYSHTRSFGRPVDPSDSRPLSNSALTLSSRIPGAVRHCSDSEVSGLAMQ